MLKSCSLECAVMIERFHPNSFPNQHVTKKLAQAILKSERLNSVFHSEDKRSTIQL